MNGRQAVSNYLSHKWDLEQLESWALEFGDDPQDRLDKWSSGIAGMIIALLHEYGHGNATADDIEIALRDVISAVGTRG